MESEYLTYGSKLSYNREVFLTNYREELAMFEESNALLQNMGSFISKTRDINGNSHVSLLFLIGIIERQARIAFDCITRYQAFTAWITFRPAVESLLIIGKFIDNPRNAEIWINRKQYKKEFKKEFTGKGLIPSSFALAKKFRRLLTKINDEFVHSNWNYLKKNYQQIPINSGTAFLIPYIDEDFFEHSAFLYSFLHIYRLMIVSIGQALGPKFGNKGKMQIDHKIMERVLAPKVEKLASEHPGLVNILETFGLYKL